ncbi:MAG TPA: GNAT family N-acetyltransferase [Ignavibacteriaceae bacterium]|nr:GNAT family N-acetyltransferase [Ignavibacteriaceae bacterium]
MRKLWIIFFYYNIYQTWAYQQIRAETDATKLSRFIVVGDDNIPFIMGQIRIKSLINFKIGYIQLGPIFQRREMMLEELPEAIKILIQNLIEKLGLDIIRINLILWKGQNDFAELFKRVGFTEAKYYRTYKTFVVSLERSEQEIFKDIDSENRRLIRKAEKLGLEFKISYNEEYLPILDKMYLEAKQRKGFTGIDFNGLWKTQIKLCSKNKLELIIVKYKAEIMAIHVTSHVGETALALLNVNSPKSHQLRFANYLWYRAYLSAKERGNKYYDLGGYDEKLNPNGYLFKRRMGGVIKQLIPPLDYYKNNLVNLIWLRISKKYYS